MAKVPKLTNNFLKGIAKQLDKKKFIHMTSPQAIASGWYGGYSTPPRFVGSGDGWFTFGNEGSSRIHYDKDGPCPDDPSVNCWHVADDDGNIINENIPESELGNSIVDVYPKRYPKTYRAYFDAMGQKHGFREKQISDKYSELGLDPTVPFDEYWNVFFDDAKKHSWTPDSYARKVQESAHKNDQKDIKVLKNWAPYMPDDISDKIKADPFSYVDDENRYIRDYARSLMF